MKEMIKWVERYTLFMLILLGIIGFTGCASTTDEGGKNGGEVTGFSLQISPSPLTITGTGQVSYFDVVVKEAEGLITSRFTISYNTSLIEVTEIRTSGNGFLFTDAGASVNVIENTYDNDAGTIVIGIGALKKGFTGASGEGRLATVTVRSRNTGSGTIAFVNTNADDIFMAQYSASDEKGWVEKTVKTVNGSLVVQ